MDRIRIVAVASTIAAGALAPAGCANLGDLQENQCGNRIIEELSEDCDGKPLGTDGKPAEDGFTCTADCRVQCGDGANGTARCPDGWGCGTDGICRRPSGSFGDIIKKGQPTVHLTENLSHLLTGDLDGDGRQELIIDTGAEVRVHFFDSSSVETQLVSINAANASPALGDFDGNGVLDLAYRLDSSVAVRLGGSDRSLPAVPFPVSLPDTLKVKANEGLIAVDTHAISGLSTSLRELLRIQDTQITTFLPTAASPNTPLTLFNVGSMNLPKPSVQIPEGQFENDITMPCHQIVFPNATTNTIEVYYPCRKIGVGAVEWNDTDKTKVKDPMKITLPPNTVLAGPVYAIDVNRDTHLDVVAYAQDTMTNEYELLVAYGNGNGDQGGAHNFGSQPPNAQPQDGMAGVYLCLSKLLPAMSCPGDAPLALVDFDGDGGLDVVNPCGLFLTHRSPSAACGQFDKTTQVLSSRQGQAQAPWSSALAVDLNADGRVDLVAASCADTSLAYYENAGGDTAGKPVFNVFSIPTTGGVDQMMAGDFDGDLVPDVVFAQRSAPLICQNPDDPTPSDSGSLGVVFGATSGGPSAVHDLGSLQSISRLVPAPFTSASGQYDLVTDLAVLSKDVHDSTSTYQTFDVFQGSTAREVVAPHFLVDQNGPADPWLITLGAFTAGSKDAGIAVIAKQANGVSFFVLDSNGYDLSQSADVQVTDIKNAAEYAHSDVLGAWTKAVNLGGGNGDSIAVLLRDSATTSSLYPITRSATAWPSSLTEQPLPGGYRGPLVVSDVDGDGFPDLLAFSESDVIVVWNKNDGTIDVSGAAHVKDQLSGACDDTGAETLQNAIAVQAAPGKGKQLLVVSDKHAYLVGHDAADTTRRTFTKATCLDKTLEGFGHDYTRAFLGVGDIDGDGIDDVVIARPGAIQVFNGIPVVR